MSFMSQTSVTAAALTNAIQWFLDVHSRFEMTQKWNSVGGKIHSMITAVVKLTLNGIKPQRLVKEIAWTDLLRGRKEYTTGNESATGWLPRWHCSISTRKLIDFTMAWHPGVVQSSYNAAKVPTIRTDLFIHRSWKTRFIRFYWRLTLWISPVTRLISL